MTQDEERKLEQRIRERAFKIWNDEGQPDGRDKQHWELAKLAVSEEDALSTMLKSPSLPGPEPIEALLNQGEFPTFVDQGQGQAPGERQ